MPDSSSSSSRIEWPPSANNPPLLAKPIPEICLEFQQPTTPLDAFPTELLIKIFGYLDYITLHNASVVCKSFYSIISSTTSGTLANKLFVGNDIPRAFLGEQTKLEFAPLHPAPKPRGVAIVLASVPKCQDWHPCLEKIFINLAGLLHPTNPRPLTVDNVMLRTTSGIGAVPFHRSSVIKENAYIHPVSYIRLSYRGKTTRSMDVHHLLDKDAGGTHGLTVQDVVNAVVIALNRFWRGRRDRAIDGRFYSLRVGLGVKVEDNHVYALNQLFRLELLKSQEELTDAENLITLAPGRKKRLRVLKIGELGSPWWRPVGRIRIDMDGEDDEDDEDGEDGKGFYIYLYKIR